MSALKSVMHFVDVKTKAVFAADAPRPQFLLDTPQFKTLVVGFEAEQRIPPHPGELAMYHFLEGEGLMTVDEETVVIQPGVTVIAQAGAVRSIYAKTRLIVLVAKAG